MKYQAFFLTFLFVFAGCATPTEAPSEAPVASLPPPVSPTPSPSPTIPDLQAEILENRNKTTTSPIGKFDFRNFTYELPRGWQNPDGTSEFTLTGGKIAPVEGTVSDDMSDEEKADIKQRRRIGMSYVATKYLDLTGDGQDEAVVVVKIETGGNAIPQIVYVFDWKDDAPVPIWHIRTGDRADGGLKDIRVENGFAVVELYGQDRFIFGQTETGRISSDEVQLCCPTHFTRTSYKWNGTSFSMQGKRLTFSVADPGAPPEENLGDKLSALEKGKR